MTHSRRGDGMNVAGFLTAAFVLTVATVVLIVFGIVENKVEEAYKGKLTGSEVKVSGTTSSPTVVSA